MSGVEIKTVSADEAGNRLKRWFKAHYPGLPFGRLAKLMRTGQVRLNGKRVKGSERLEAGDEIRVPPLDPGPAPKKSKPLQPSEKSEIERLVIYRDPDFMVLNKPSGLAVQGGSGTSRHVDRLLPGLMKKGDQSPPRLVHRLDKDTSGLLLIARSGEAARFFTRAFKEKQVKKIYWALVRGVPKKDEGRILASLQKSTGKKEIMEVSPEGKKAETLYRVLDRAGEEAAFVALSPLTGRTHQLRIHMAHLGHPILGDGKYGGEAAHMPDLSNKLHLHAAGLIFPLPGGGTTRITAPLPAHIADSFAYFGFNRSVLKAPFEAFSDD